MSQKRFKLSILICAIEERKHKLIQLLRHLEAQSTKEVEILVKSDDRQMSIGEKRNFLLQEAKGDYVCFIDDDDWVDGEYIPLILEALKSKPDVVGIVGIMSTNGKSQRRFEHTILYGGYFELNTIYCRPPNHLNPMKRSIAIQFEYKEINMGEDTDWALRVMESHLNQVEVMIDKPIYHYLYQTKK